MSSEELAELCDAAWGLLHMEESMAINSSRGQKEFGFPICFDETRKLHSGPVCRGNECSIEIKRCSDKAIEVGSYHTHPNGIILFSAVDITTALDRGNTIISLGTMKDEVVAIKTLLVDYDKSEQVQPAMEKLKEATEEIMKLDAVLEEIGNGHRELTAKELDSVYKSNTKLEQFFDEVAKIGFLVECSPPCYQGMWQRRV